MRASSLCVCCGWLCVSLACALAAARHARSSYYAPTRHFSPLSLCGLCTTAQHNNSNNDSSTATTKYKKWKIEHKKRNQKKFVYLARFGLQLSVKFNGVGWLWIKNKSLRLKILICLQPKVNFNKRRKGKKKREKEREGWECTLSNWQDLPFKVENKPFHVSY